MKFAVAIILTALLALAGGLWFGWWVIAPASFLVALLVHQRAGKAFLSGGAGGLLLWGGLAWWIDAGNGSLLSKKVAEILPLGGSPFLLILVTAVIAGLVAGCAALSGSYLRGNR